MKIRGWSFIRVFNTVLVGDDVRELLGTFSEEEYSGDETAVQGTIEDMPE